MTTTLAIWLALSVAWWGFAVKNARDVGDTLTFWEAVAMLAFCIFGLPFALFAIIGVAIQGAIESITNN